MSEVRKDGVVFLEDQGNGYATEAVVLCLRHAFDDRSLHKVWAQVIEGNEASMRALEKLGFGRKECYGNRSTLMVNLWMSTATDSFRPSDKRHVIGTALIDLN